MIATIRQLELMKQIKPPLTDQQVLVLVLRLGQENWSPAEFRDRARRIERMSTYGTLAVEYWLNQEVEELEEERSWHRSTYTPPPEGVELIDYATYTERQRNRKPDGSTCND